MPKVHAHFAIEEQGRTVDMSFNAENVIVNTEYHYEDRPYFGDHDKPAKRIGSTTTITIHEREQG